MRKHRINPVTPGTVIRRHLAPLLLLVLPLWCISAPADSVRVAVASNFSGTLQKLATAFTGATGHELKISSASTGKLYAQIRQGAPFDVFLAADAERPRLLVAEGLAVADTLTTYAEGRLVLWSPDGGYPAEANGEDILRRGQFRQLAIANPRTAPYGNAAREALQQMGLWQRLESTVARGENIGQTFQFVMSGAADLGMVALSQLQGNAGRTGYIWPVPTSLYRPIVQQGVLLARSRDRPAPLAFIAFLRSDTAAAIIERQGYRAERNTG